MERQRERERDRERDRQRRQLAIHHSSDESADMSPAVLGLARTSPPASEGSDGCRRVNRRPPTSE